MSSKPIGTNTNGMLLRTLSLCGLTEPARDQNVSHIASGYIYNSPSNKKVRADVASDSGFASSLFDYADITSEGLVSNTLYDLQPCIAATPQIWHGYVNPTFPLFSTDILVTSNAVFGGIVDDQFNGKVASVSYFSTTSRACYYGRLISSQSGVSYTATVFLSRFTSTPATLSWGGISSPMTCAQELSLGSSTL